MDVERKWNNKIFYKWMNELENDFFCLLIIKTYMKTKEILKKSNNPLS